MQLTQHTDAFAIRGIETRGDALVLKIADAWHSAPLLLHADALITDVADYGLAKNTPLTVAAVPQLLASKPAVVILGTGARAVFPTNDVRAAFLQHGIGLEVMDTRAAAYTYNVLLQEQRAVLLVVLA
jgi:uncharacterized protein